MARKLTVGSRAVGVAILAEALNAADKAVRSRDGDVSPQAIAEYLIDEAHSVEYKPTAERLVITLDAGIDYDTTRGSVYSNDRLEESSSV